MSEHARTIKDLGTLERYALAGGAVLTLRSVATGVHQTFKVWKWAESDEDRWFVSVLAGPDRYVYVGMLSRVYLQNPPGPPVPTAGLEFKLTQKSKFTRSSTPFRAFDWFVRRVLNERDMRADVLEVRHEGSCGRCGRPLTRPDSIDRGIGPDCWEAMGGKDTDTQQQRLDLVMSQGT